MPITRTASATTPADGSVTNAKVATNAAVSADKLADGTTNKVLTATERTKLSGVATGATAYTDETAQDAAATLFTSGSHSGVSFTYDDTNAKLNATVTGGAASATVLAPAPSGGDDLAALSAVIPTRGALQLRSGTYRLSGMLTLGSGQDLRGVNGNLMDPATTILCTAAGAGVTFSEAGGTSGGFYVDGNFVATVPFRRNLVTDSAYRTFIDISVANSAQDNMTVIAAQNDLFLSIVTRHAARDNLYIDQGMGGTVFVRFESDEPGRYGVRIDNVISGGPYNLRPTHISFHHSLFEREWAGHSTTSQLYLKNCEVVAFHDCVIFGGSTMLGPLIDIYAPTRVLFTGGFLDGSNPSSGTAFRLDDGANLVLANTVRIENLLNGISMSGTPNVRVIGNIFWNSVTNRYAGTGAQDDSVQFDIDHPVRVFRDATGNTAFASYIQGEAGVRFQINGDGSIGFNDGVGYTPKATLFAGGSNILSMPSTQVLKTGKNVTASRPSASTVGQGAQFYDTTLGKPIWSNGTVWKDAAGTTV